jgi:putative NADH-flavin reductase
MRVLVIGAAGRTGRLVVDAALGHGHEVTAFTRTSALEVQHLRLRPVHGDALDFDSVSAAVEGQDAVIVTLGRTAGSASALYEPAIGHVVHAMALHGVCRIAVLSAAGTFARTDSALGVKFRFQIATKLRSSYDDLEGMERRIMASALDWTVVRPFGLSDEPARGDYRISLTGELLPKAGRVPRGDVAGVLLKSVESDAYRRKTVVLAG